MESTSLSNYCHCTFTSSLCIYNIEISSYHTIGVGIIILICMYHSMYQYTTVCSQYCSLITVDTTLYRPLYILYITTHIPLYTVYISVYCMHTAVCALSLYNHYCIHHYVHCIQTLHCAYKYIHLTVQLFDITHTYLVTVEILYLDCVCVCRRPQHFVKPWTVHQSAVDDLKLRAVYLCKLYISAVDVFKYLDCLWKRTQVIVTIIQYTF